MAVQAKPKKHKDALKRARQNEKRRLRNKRVRTFYRNRVKEVRAAIAAKDVEAAEAALLRAYQAVDKAASKGVIKKNTAARYKSRLAKAVNALKSSSQPAAA